MPLMLPPYLRKKNGVSQASALPGRSLGGNVPAIQRVAPQPAMSQAPTTPQSDPRAAKGTVPSSIMDIVTAHIGAEQATLSAGNVGPLNTRAIPNAHDVIELVLTVAWTYNSASAVTGTIQASSAIAQVNIRTPDGSVIMSILGENLHSYFERFSKWTNDFTDTAYTVLASQTGTAGNTSAIPVPVRLPAKYGPYQVDIIYAPLANLGAWAANNGPLITAATGVTAATFTVQQDAIYGDAGGYESHLVPATFGGLGAGVNDIAQTFPVKNKAVAEVALYNLAADADLDKIIILTNGQAIEPYLPRAVLAARDTHNIQAARPVAANADLYWLYPSTSFAVNPTTQFQVFLVPGATTTSIRTWVYYLEPAA